MLCPTNGFNFISNDKIGREMVWKNGFHLTYDRTAISADNFTKYLNINLSIDFNVNSNFNNNFLDWQ